MNSPPRRAVFVDISGRGQMHRYGVLAALATPKGFSGTELPWTDSQTAIYSLALGVSGTSSLS